MAIQPHKFTMLQFEMAVIAGMTKSQIREEYGISNDTIERRARQCPRFQGYGLPLKIQEFSHDYGEQDWRPVNDQNPVTSDEEITAGPYLLSEAIGNDKKIRYVYNRETDSYINFLKSAPEPVVISGPMHRDMLAAYSNWDGQPSTLNQLCRNFSFPRPWLVEYLHHHGITHDKEPFSAEELMEHPVEDLVEVALQKKRQALFQKYETAKWQETKQDAERWRNFKHNGLDPLLEAIKLHVPAYTVPRMSLYPGCGREQFALVMSPTDLHVGKYGWNDAAGITYSKAQAKQLLMFHTQQIATQVLRHGLPEQIFIPVGSDWFHVDTPQTTTTAGTTQDLDGVPENLMFEAKMMAVEHIDLCRQLGPVTLVFCPGNHDWAHSLDLLHFLYAWYRDAPDVQVQLATQPRQYFSYGNSLCGATHGNDERKTQLGPLMATEAKEAWGQTQFRYWFTGHFHFEESRDYDGVEVFQLPALGPADRWHDKHGYCLSRRALHAHMIDFKRGITGIFISAVVEPQNSRPVTYGFKLKNQAR
jgi:hypothetical protein